MVQGIFFYVPCMVDTIIYALPQDCCLLWHCSRIVLAWCFIFSILTWRTHLSKLELGFVPWEMYFFKGRGAVDPCFSPHKTVYLASVIVRSHSAVQYSFINRFIEPTPNPPPPRLTLSMFTSFISSLVIELVLRNYVYIKYAFVPLKWYIINCDYSTIFRVHGLKTIRKLKLHVVTKRIQKRVSSMSRNNSYWILYRFLIEFTRCITREC